MLKGSTSSENFRVIFRKITDNSIVFFKFDSKIFSAIIAFFIKYNIVQGAVWFSKINWYQYYKRKRGNCSTQKTRKSSAQTLLLNGVETWRFLARWYKKGKLRGLSFRIFDLGLWFFVNDVGSWDTVKLRN